MKSGIMKMMCCRRPSPLPHSDDVLGIVSACLPVATLSLCLACTLSLERITRLCSEKNQNIKQSYSPCPMQSLCGQRWKIILHTKTTEVCAVVPPVDRNLRSRQECVRAWLWLSSKQISLRRQVCSAFPHSCSCLQLFLLLSGAALTMCSKTGMLAQ